MSLAIDIDRVQKVLIAGKWYHVFDASFVVDSFEFIWFATPGGEPDAVSGGEVGCSFVIKDEESQLRHTMFAPLSAIQGVRYNYEP